jgi:hypothetical protein
MIERTLRSRASALSTRGSVSVSMHSSERRLRMACPARLLPTGSRSGMPISGEPLTAPVIR